LSLSEVSIWNENCFASGRKHLVIWVPVRTEKILIFHDLYDEQAIVCFDLSRLMIIIKYDSSF
jgi:hypothetical protein